MSDVKFRTLAMAAVVAAGAAFAGGAQAATFQPCSGAGVPVAQGGAGTPWDVSGAIDGATQCSWRTDVNQDFLNNPMTVNEGTGFFDKTDWVFGGKIGANTGYNGSGSGQSGTFDVTGVADLVGKTLMAIFKDGSAGNKNDPAFPGTDPTGLVGYILGQKSGNWVTPFTPAAIDEVFGPSINNAKNVSHISIYYRSPGTNEPPPPSNVPVPASLPLLLTALGAAAFLRRRAKTSA